MNLKTLYNLAERYQQRVEEIVSLFKESNKIVQQR
jgi:hypothetical protein